MARKNKTTAASVPEAAATIAPNAASAAEGTHKDIVTPADDITPEDVITPADDTPNEVEKVPEVLPEGVIRVRAVIRSLYAPFNGIMIPDDGPGVLVERGSWIDVQLKRGLIQEC